MAARLLPACQNGTRHPDTWHTHDPAEQAEARAVCLACPRRPACLAAALATEAGWAAANRHGIYGALDGDQRADLDPTTGTVTAPAPCGTTTAHRQHRVRKEQACPSCRAAHHDANQAAA